MSSRMKKENKKLKFFLKACVRDRQLIFLTIIPLTYYFVFKYLPMYGIQIAFRDFVPSRGVTGSEWIGFEHFITFFKSYFFWSLIRNTLLLKVYSLLWGFPIPILFALMLNEISNPRYKKFVQSITYFPHFISTVIIVSMLTMLFSADTGILNMTSIFNNGKDISMTQNPDFFRSLYIGSGIWQTFGFSSVLYIAAIAGIPVQLYEAAEIDGANRLQRVMYITFPAIVPIIMIRLLLSLGSLFSQGPEKILLMYSPSTYKVADVISTYVYRVGLAGMKYGFGTAVELFNTILNFIMLITFNTMARKFSETSLW